MKHLAIGKLNPSLIFMTLVWLLSSCDKDNEVPSGKSVDITIENVLESKSLVQSGTFKGTGTSPVIFPGQSVSFSFYGGPGQSITFATMYGWSNDLFFAPENPGIKLYDNAGMPISGDVSTQIKLWDNGTRINQAPGVNVSHPGTAESAPKSVIEVAGTDVQGNSYLPASQLIKASLAYDGNSRFTITLTNVSGGTANETPFSPGVWAVSYSVGNELQNAMPIYTKGQAAANGLTNIAEMGDNSVMSAYLTGLTGIFTPLSPVLVVVYNGNENPFFKVGEKDRGEGLKNLAQMGDADVLAKALRTKAGVKDVYVLKESNTTVLLPKIGGTAGGRVSQELTLAAGDRIAIATMYGFSKDWFFSTTGNGIDAMATGDVSSLIGLYDNGTASDLFPGASGGAPAESKSIQEVANPNSYTTLPAINQMIKVVLNR